jgi:hypothetical protein
MAAACILSILCNISKRVADASRMSLFSESVKILPFSAPYRLRASPSKIHPEIFDEAT